MKKKNFTEIKSCPICSQKKIFDKGLINSKISEINNFFKLIKCFHCNHRFLSKFPKKSFLNKLHKKNSKYLFSQDIHEKNLKKDFRKNGFKNVKPFDHHWIFGHINMEKKNEYLEIGPGLCRMYKTFFIKNWSCHGIDLQPFIKAPGIIRNISNDN